MHPSSQAGWGQTLLGICNEVTLSHGNLWFSVVTGNCQQSLPGEIISVISVQLIIDR